MPESLGEEIQVKVIANQSTVYAALDDGAVLPNTDSGVYHDLDEGVAGSSGLLNLRRSGRLPIPPSQS